MWNNAVERFYSRTKQSNNRQQKLLSTAAFELTRVKLGLASTFHFGQTAGSVPGEVTVPAGLVLHSLLQYTNLAVSSQAMVVTIGSTRLLSTKGWPG